MIVPFGLRHIWLMRELRRSSVALNCKGSLLEEPADPFRRALHGYFLKPTADVFTFIMCSSANAPRLCGFVQAGAQHSVVPWAGQQAPVAWQVAAMSPALNSCAEGATVWYRLLLHLCIAAGEKHVQRLYARLPEDSSAEDVFRQASFSVYCHESVFCRADGASLGLLSPRMHSVSAKDQWDLHRLWAQLTPQPVVHAEGANEARSSPVSPDRAASGTAHGYAWRNHAGAMQGYLHLLVKPRGVWLRLLVYPESGNSATEMLDHAFAVLAGLSSRPVYCAVRDYEGGLQGLLEERGFSYMDSHSLLVKHTTVRVRQPRRTLVPSLEKRAEAAPTASRSHPGGL